MLASGAKIFNRVFGWDFRGLWTPEMICKDNYIVNVRLGAGRGEGRACFSSNSIKFYDYKRFGTTTLRFPFL